MKHDPIHIYVQPTPTVMLPLRSAADAAAVQCLLLRADAILAIIRAGTPDLNAGALNGTGLLSAALAECNGTVAAIVARTYSPIKL